MKGKDDGLGKSKWSIKMYILYKILMFKRKFKKHFENILFFSVFVSIYISLFVLICCLFGSLYSTVYLIKIGVFLMCCSSVLILMAIVYLLFEQYRTWRAEK